MSDPMRAGAPMAWHMARDSWLRYWFTAAPPTNLGAGRAVVFGGVFLLYLFHDMSAWAEVSEAFWMPIWAFHRFGLAPLTPWALEAIEWLFKVALLFAAVGLWTRVASGISCVLAFYLFGLPHNFGQTYHFDAVLVFVFGILTVARSGDGVSIDALRRPARPAPSGEYRWPVRLVWVTMATVFFAAGLAKLRHAGLAWAFSDNMAIILTKAHYGVSDADPLVNWGLVIARSPILSRALALVSLVVETTFPLALVSRRAALVLVPGAFMMLVGIRVLMGPTFGGFLLVFAFWVPWTAVGAAVRAWWPVSRRYTALYDGSCGTCGRTMEIVRRLDVLGRIEVLDAANEWSAIAQRFRGLDRARCLQDMHVVTPGGRAPRGFEAYRALAWALPIGWTLLPFLYLPGVPMIGRAVYRAVASRRLHDGCLVPAPEGRSESATTAGSRM